MLNLSKFFVERVIKHPYCFIWPHQIMPNGYGRNGNTTAHRYVWTAINGRIPKGYHLDHLCKNKACVNVDHLECVTPKENAWRGTGICTRLTIREMFRSY
jgi:hypothetical protein